jgi:hypothetical protein
LVSLATARFRTIREDFRDAAPAALPRSRRSPVKLHHLAKPDSSTIFTGRCIATSFRFRFEGDWRFIAAPHPIKPLPWL